MLLGDSETCPRDTKRDITESDIRSKFEGNR